MRLLSSALLSLVLAPLLPAQSAQSDRIVPHPNLTATTLLPGHIPAWARTEADEGPLPDGAPLRVTLVLARSPERQAAFTQLLADQQNPASPSYHHWLTPQQIGDQYGPTQHDLDTLSTWLASRGLAVTEIAPSRIFLHADAPAATLARAFSTTLHTFRVGGDSLRAPLTDPTIPTAFAPLVQSVAGLSDTPLHPMHQHHSAPAPQSNTLHPQYSLSSGTHYVTPGDFATIFNLKPTYAAGYNGAGQKVAIIGRSRVAAADISLFEANTGLPTNLPNTIIPPNGVDPGVTGNGDQSEATLDLVRVLGTAPGVQADLIVSGTANGLNGIYLAAQYNVQTLLDPVMNISFGSCETYAGPSQVNLWDTLFAQAAGEGISVFVSAADSGAATCDAQFGLVPAYQFRSINYICASSYATCVGGTEFADTANASAFWSATNGANLASALSYIPEGAWNEPQTSTGTYVAASGGGGASIYIPKPSWQTGAGVPADGARDVPDISFPAAAHDGYYACYAIGGGDCAANRFEYFYGTSAAAPAMAAVTAILNQKTGSSHGNLNPLLYRTAAATPAAFHDTTPASSGVLNCSVTTASICNNTLPSPSSLTGGLVGYALTTGYDQATGLGSLDITNFLNANSTSTPTLAVGKLILAESASTIANTQTVVFTATYTTSTAGTPTGTVQFYANAAPIGSPVTIVSSRAVSPALPFPAAGSYDITAVYSGDSAFAQTTAPGIALTVTGLTAIPKVAIASLSFVVGSTQTLTATFPASGSTAPTGMIRFLVSGAGTSSYIATAPLSAGTASTPALTFSTPGTYTLTAYYLGDSIYSPSSSPAITYTVRKVQSVVQLSSTVSQVGVGGYKQYYVSILSTDSVVGTPKATGTMQFQANGVPLGAPFDIQATYAPAQLFTTAGAYTITGVYSGDTNWQSATGTAVPLTIVPDPAGYQLYSSPSLTLTAGVNATNSANVSVTAINGFQGMVSLACSLVYNGTSTAVSPPTCSISGSTQTLTTINSLISVPFTITSIASSAKQPGTPLSRSHSPLVLWKKSSVGVLLGLLLCWIPGRKRDWTKSASLLSLTLLVLGLAGCGSNSSPTAQAPAPTPVPVVGTTKGNYTITITSSTNITGASGPTPVTIALTIN